MKGFTILIALLGVELICQGCASTDYFNYYSCDGQEILGTNKTPFRISLNDGKVKIKSSGKEQTFFLGKELDGFATLERIDSSNLLIDYGPTSLLPKGFIDLKSCEMYPFGR